MTAADEEYLQIVLDAIGVCARYKPKFGLVERQLVAAECRCPGPDA